MGWVINATPRPLTPRKDPVPTVQQVGWASGLVWTVAENLAPTGIRSPDRPVRSCTVIFFSLSFQFAYSQFCYHACFFSCSLLQRDEQVDAGRITRAFACWQLDDFSDHYFDISLDDGPFCYLVLFSFRDFLHSEVSREQTVLYVCCSLTAMYQNRLYCSLTAMYQNRLYSMYAAVLPRCTRTDCTALLPRCIRTDCTALLSRCTGTDCTLCMLLSTWFPNKWKYKCADFFRDHVRGY